MESRRDVVRACLLATLFLLSGCTDLQVLFGARVRLEGTPVKSVSARIEKGPAMYPGQKTVLIVSVTQPDGKILLTEGAADGVVLWEDLRFDSTLLSVDKKGYISLAADPALSEGKMPRLKITVPSHPGISTELTIPLRYDAAFVANFSGKPGEPGRNGSDGMRGRDGSDGSSDRKHPSAGGNGGNGERGENGDGGGDGGDALPVLVALKLRPGAKPMLQARVSNGIKTERFLVDTQGGTLNINASGGAGGAGGDGGAGGSGGDGGDGNPKGHKGKDGKKGMDGWPGSAGKPSTITVEYDPGAQPYLNMLTFSNCCVAGKPGPAPTFQSKPLGALW